MKLRALIPPLHWQCFCLIALITGGCVSPAIRVDPLPETDTTLRIRLSESGKGVNLPLERYVVGSVLAEADFRSLDTDSAKRVAQIQSILARTYALANLNRHEHEGFHLCDTTHCQVYRQKDGYPETLTALVEESVDTTAGLVITHKGQPINAVFHADCGGGTSDASVPWGGISPPYLRGTPDDFCIREPSPPWHFKAKNSEVFEALNPDHHKLAESQIAHVSVATLDQTGRAIDVSLIGVNGQTRTIRGERFRSTLVKRFGYRSVRSTRFTIEQISDFIVIKGRGFGHGVGLCQRGAMIRAKNGHSPQAILSHYYPGTKLTRN